MEFKVIRYFRFYKLYRNLVIFILIAFIVDSASIQFINLSFESNYYLLPFTIALIILSFKIIFTFFDYYKVVGKIFIDNDSIILNGNLCDEAKVLYVGHYGMNKWYYIPFFIILTFYWPKFGRSFFYDGVNVVICGKEKFYFLSENKNDFIMLKDAETNNHKLKISKRIFL